MNQSFSLPRALSVIIAFFLMFQVVQLVSFTPSVTAAFSGSGSGTTEDPYQITNADELNETRDDLGANYTLMNDIDLAGCENWDDGKGFLPIGTMDYPFTGSFDGQNYNISNLFIDREYAFGPAGEYVSLFGVIGHDDGTFAGTIKNLSMIDVDVTGYQLAGGLAGCSYGTISYCHTTGVVSAIRAVAGGFIGDNIGQINSCYSTAEVVTPYAAGGFAGINNMYITNCYSRGDVTGDERVGGFVGGTDHYVGYCYSTGAVTGDTDVGGFIGINYMQVTSCYWDTVTSGQGSSDGGTGMTTAEMTYDYDGYDPPCSGLYETWNLGNESSIWLHDTTGTINSGYPYLCGVESEGELADPTFTMDDSNVSSFTNMNACIQQGRDCALYAVYCVLSGEEEYRGFHLACSNDNGTTWSIHGFLEDYDGDSSYTFMIDANGTFHLSWVESYPHDEFGIYSLLYSRSYDNGVTWDVPIILISDESFSVASVTGCLDVYDNVHLFYCTQFGMACIYHIVSMDGGDTWNNDAPNLVNDTENRFFTVASDFDENNYLYVVFSEDTDGDPPNYFYITSSIDNGTIWSEPVLINDTVTSWYLDSFHIAIDSSHTIHFVGSMSNESGYYQLVYTRSFDHGETWDALANFTEFMYTLFYDAWISVDAADTIYVSFIDGLSDFYIYYYDSSDGGDSFYEPSERTLLHNGASNNMNVWWSNYPERCDHKCNVPNAGVFVIENDYEAGYLYDSFSFDFTTNCCCFPEYVPPPPDYYPIDTENNSDFTSMNTCIQQGRNCTLYVVYLAPTFDPNRYWFRIASSNDNGTTWSIHSFLDGYYTYGSNEYSFMIDANGTMHFAFVGYDDDYYLMYSQSTDDGATWSTPVDLVYLYWYDASLTGCLDYYDNIHIFYQDSYNDGSAIFHIVSMDGGDTWNNAVPDIVTWGDYVGYYFTVASDFDEESYLYMVYFNSDDYWVEIMSSTDNGTTWSEPVCVNDTVYEWDTEAFHIAIDSFHTIHFEGYYYDDGPDYLSYTRSFDHGQTWDSLATLVNGYQSTWITIDSNDIIYIPYIGEAGYLYYFSSSDGGDSFYGELSDTLLSDDFSFMKINAWWSNYPECTIKFNVPTTGMFLVFVPYGDNYLYDAFTDDFAYDCCGGGCSAPGAPSGFTATTIYDDRIDLSWTIGSGATHTRIQRKTNTYPTSITDGINVYNGTGTSCSDTGLLSSTTYYYRAWSWDDECGLWSVTGVSASNTTFGSGGGGGGGNGGGNNKPATPGTPAGTSILSFDMNTITIFLLIGVILALLILIIAASKRRKNEKQ